MNADQRIEALEGDVKLLKNEIKAVLLDVREHYLDYQNPFTRGALPVTAPAVVAVGVVGGPGPAAEPPPPRHDGPAGAAPSGRHEGQEGRRPGPGAGQDPAVPGLPPVAGEKKSSPPPAPVVAEETTSIPGLPDTGPGECRLDLSAVAALAVWVDEAVALIGRERLKALVDVRYAGGKLPGAARTAVLMLARSCPQRSPGGRVSGRQYLMVLSELDELMGIGGEDRAPSSLLLADRRPEGRRERDLKTAAPGVDAAEAAQTAGSNR